jgi:hypothetical protein
MIYEKVLCTRASSFVVFSTRKATSNLGLLKYFGFKIAGPACRSGNLCHRLRDTQSLSLFFVGAIYMKARFVLEVQILIYICITSINA